MFYYYDLKDSHNKRARLLNIASRMKLERQSLDSMYLDISSQIEPTRSRFFVGELNDGWRYNSEIIDSTPRQALNILKAGMLSGICSPSRHWFKLDVASNIRNQFPSIKEWLDETTTAMRTRIAKTNFYEQAQVIFGDTGAFATGCMFVDKDQDRLIKTSTQPVGSYYLGVNEDYKIDMYFREYVMTVRQVVNKFCKDPFDGKYDFANVSETIKTHFNNGEFENEVLIGHLILPNHDFDPLSDWSKKKKYISHYFELGFRGNDRQGYEVSQQAVLSERGYDKFPVLSPRWARTGEDIYGTDCPGMTTLGDCFQLQIGERKSLKAIDKLIDPAMVAHPSLRNQKTSLLPGSVTYIDESKLGSAAYREAHQVRFDVNAMEMKQQQVRQRIQRGFYADLFLMLANSDRRQITATEIAERHEEKLIALGPVLENLNNDFLDPFIDILYDYMDEAGEIPPIPEELDGVDIKVEYTSILAQAQKAVGLGSIERAYGFGAQLAQMDPRALKKFDVLTTLDEYVDQVGAPSKILRSNDEVEEMETQEARAMQTQMQMQQAQQQAQVQKTLSETDMEKDSALRELVSGGS